MQTCDIFLEVIDVCSLYVLYILFNPNWNVMKIKFKFHKKYLK